MDMEPLHRPSASEPGFIVPTPAATTSRRPGLLTAAGWILIVFGALGVVAGVLLLGQGQSQIEGLNANAAHGATLVTLAVSAMELFTGVLVLRRRPAGRRLGFIFAGIGVASSLIRLPRASGPGLIGLAVSCFVIYALGVNGVHFRPTPPR